MTTHRPAPTRRARMWGSRSIRGAIVAFGFTLTVVLSSLVFTAGPASAATRPCGTSHADVARHKAHLPCIGGTNKHVKSCVTGVAGTMLVGGIFGGPIGILGGFAGGLVGCAAMAVSS